MKVPFIDHMVRKVGIDLGSSTIRVWTDKQSEILAEPACIAIEQGSRRVLAVGSEALAMEGRVSKQIKVHWPIQRGVVYDMEIARALLKVLIKKVTKNAPLLSLIMMVTVPAGSTDAERTSSVDLVSGLGASEVYTIVQPLAASIGSGVPIADASGSFFLHMGADRVEGAVISLGSLAAYQSSEYAGAYCVRRIKQVLRKELSLVVSTQTAQKILHSVVSLYPQSKRTLLVAGQDLHTSSPKEVSVKAAVLQPEFFKLMERYEVLLQKLLSQIPPELTVDIIDKGLLLSGSLAQLDGIDTYLMQKIGTPTSVVEQPEQVAIMGVATALEHLDLFKQSLMYQTSQFSR